MPAWALASAVPLALVIDRAFGEPPAWAHPVVAMGRCLGPVGPWLTSLPPALAFAAGSAAWLAGASIAVGLAVGADAALTLLPWPLGLLALALLLKPLLSWRMLRNEVAAVDAVLGDSLQAGRERLKRLVSRDVDTLDAGAVRESAIESLAENLNDSLVAPLFWFAVAGLPGAALYRFANTADAMWGYRGRWEWAGKWAAHADDLLSWLPARLTAVLLCAAAWRWPGLPILVAQARRTPSPNGGWPMGAMALLLGVRLGKPGVYLLNDGGAVPEPHHTRQALRWSQRAVWLAGAAAWLGALR
ncbi:adenosylcobinamide-phosphate synthase CbiB [Piscinibacter sp.]|uniref:adenosylcobinamide-phosphate synthase CbiB n=1 Tax=Piscinibacter sp. TaxID=1903157 RepID=UPI002CD794A2|nr:adenosylcobinamide-phosphate synthase CbiB [Albitalea sp.]HUG25480.1 adenosylcobinamide-phosphate synthase CbiB [Albitalea sp.]